MTEWIAVALGIAAAGGQVINLVMHLRIRVAILESRQELLKECDERYVAKDACNERHGRLPAPEMVRIR